MICGDWNNIYFHLNSSLTLFLSYTNHKKSSQQFLKKKIVKIVVYLDFLLYGYLKAFFFFFCFNQKRMLAIYVVIQ